MIKANQYTKNPQTPFERLLDKSDKTPGVGPHGECWQWNASVNSKGYGRFNNGIKTTGAHRAAYELHNNVSAKGFQVLHHCDNPGCVNTNHLFLGTNSDNMNDKMAKGRHHSKRITHCPHGHEYTDVNTYLYRGRRNCRTCIKIKRNN